MTQGRSLAPMAAICFLAFVLAGCNILKDAIEVSDESHDFRSSRQAWNLKVWDSSTVLTKLKITATPSESWIHVSPSTVTSAGESDVKMLTISVSRQGLAKGKHEGCITLSATGAKQRTVDISLYSDGTEGVLNGNLNVCGISETFSSPYLIDFTFSLRDEDNLSVIGEPNQFQVTPMEEGVPISDEENPPYFTKASAKQFKSFLVLDYTASMASIQTHGDSDGDGKSDAIEAMEAAVTGSFLPVLSDDTLVGVYEFNRETTPERVCAPSADKDFVAERVNAIWTQIVQSYWGPSRCWDAAYAAIDEFGTENRNDENRNVIVVTDGCDTSSIHTREDVIANALARGVRVHAIGFGEEADVATLEAMTEQTNGQYYSAIAIEDLDDAFLQVVDDLAGQYTLRWATLKRADVEFTPSFQVTLGKDAAGCTSTSTYGVYDYAGDELSGVLRVVPSSSDDKSTFFLRACYAPRYIWKLRFYVESPLEFSIAKVETADGGLCGGWIKTTETDTTRGGKWITLESPSVGSINSPIPFAAFGPILRFDFNQVLDEDSAPFDVLYVDNTIYSSGQNFSIQGWDNLLP